MKEFSSAIEETLFTLTVPRAQAQMGYKTDEVQMTAVDEFYVEQDKCGRVLRQIARVRVFFLGFLSGNILFRFSSTIQSQTQLNAYFQVCLMSNWESTIFPDKERKLLDVTTSFQ